jgi:AcrR family transcriptional regulator
VTGSKHEPVTLERLAQVTLEVIHRDGVGAVTMRGIADQLGVQAASLYHHIRNKDALLDLVLMAVGSRLGPEVIGAYETVETLDEWIDVTRRITLMAYEFHAEHPGIANLMLKRAFPGDGSHRELATIAMAEVEALVRAGLPASQAIPVYQTFARWTLAEIAAETSEPFDAHPEGSTFFKIGLELFLTGVKLLVMTPRTTRNQQESMPPSPPTST